MCFLIEQEAVASCFFGGEKLEEKFAPTGKNAKSIIAEPIKFHRQIRRGDLWSPVIKF